jgi:hypothetical protein
MTDHSRDLERRYRRWLSLYPSAYRAEREEEMVSVLMEGSDPGQRRPRPREAASLAAHGLRKRGGRRIPGDWERAHARVMFPVRIVIALWLCFISSMLVGFHRGQLWLLLLVPAIALHLLIAYRIRPASRQ